MLQVDDELIARLAVFIPLAIITLQVVLLRRMLTSSAWTMLTLGFITFAGIRGVLVFANPPEMSLIVASGIGYTLIAVGFYTLRKDLQRVLRNSRSMVKPNAAE